MRIQFRCLPGMARGGAVVFLLLWFLLVVLVVGVQVSLSHEERGVQPQRQSWNQMYGASLAAHCLLLCDALQIMALQVLLPSQLSSLFFQSALWLAGAALGPGTWTPTLGLFPQRSIGLWFPIIVLPALVAFAVAVSLALARSVWKRSPQRPVRLCKRVTIACRLLTWSMLPTAVWALASTAQPFALVCCFG